MRTLSSLVFGLALTGLVPACKSSEKSKDPPAAPASASAPAPVKAGLGDAQIAAIVVAANQVDIEAGNLAAGKSKNADVVTFARLMITDHTAVNNAAVALVTKLGVTPEASDASRGLVSGGESTRARLAVLDGAAFDQAYVDNEVAYHEEVIRVVDTALLPAAANAELKQMLTDVRPALQTHLDHARKIQAALAGGAGAGHAAGH